MKQKNYSVQIWFLDNDINQSAQYLTNKTLLSSIDGCFHALSCARLYYIGIRSKTFYKHFFSKDNAAETKDRFFPLWPLKQNPSMMTYNSHTSKWCRKCKEHYDYVKRYLETLLLEYEFRFNKQHGLAKYVEWEDIDAPKLIIPNANITNITLPWKCLDPKWRRKNIIDGYRLKFMNSFEDDDVYKAYACSKRDIPEFVVKYFKLDISGI